MRMRLRDGDIMISLSWRALRAWKHLRKGVTYATRPYEGGDVWLSIWTPQWHAGRGPYVTMGIRGRAWYRGY